MNNELEVTEYNAIAQDDTTATSNSTTLTIGMVLDGKYEIKREIARGGMGIVYEAYHKFFNKKVAIKIIFSNKINSLQLKRFQKEIEACAKLSHPNLIHIYNAGIYENKPYIVMDYIDGVDICQYVAQHDENYGKQKQKLHNAGLGIKRDWKLCAQLIYETALALEYIHKQKMFHRDIKPSNIIVRSDGTPIIIDLGVVKFQSEKVATLTKTGELVGTLQYMPIEQAEGKRGGIDARSDIYSLGLVLYELLTEKMAYSGKNVMETYHKIMSCYPPLPREINPQIPEVLEEITIHATEKKKEKRYATAQEFADALKKYLDDENSSTTKKYNYYKKRVRVQQNKKSVVACCIAVVVLLIATIAMLSINSISKVNTTKEAISQQKQNGVSQNYKKAYSQKAEELYQQGRDAEKIQNYSKAINFYQKASQQGHAEASFALSQIYKNGLGVNYDSAKGNYWYNTAIKQGYDPYHSNSKTQKFIYKDITQEAKGQFALGVMYYLGKGIQQDYKKAFECFQKASNQGYAEAQYYLGLIYQYGQEGEQDYKKAFELFQKASNQGHEEAQCSLGTMYYSGKGIEQDYKKALECFQQASSQGETDSQCYVGYMHYHGLGIEQNYEKAFEYFQQASNQGHAVAQCYLGRMYYYGLGIEQNYEKAFEYFQQASSQGEAVAQCYLGCMCYYGLGVQKDEEKAFEWLQKVNKKLTNAQYILKIIMHPQQKSFEKLKILLEKNAKKGLTNAQIDLGIIYFYGLGINADLKKARNYFEKASKKNHIIAQFNLGYMYYKGLGVDTNFEKAQKLFEKVANQECIEAQHYLGEMYSDGEGVKQNDLQSAYWYEKAANNGYGKAQTLLGQWYWTGGVLKQDYEKAIYWFEKAANQENTTAQTLLGKMYYLGLGTKQDYEKAIYWFEKAANQENTKAQTLLGEMYYFGIGIRRDYKKAFECFQKASNQGHEEAQFYLGEIYYKGLGVDQDSNKALEWFQKASNQGHEEAKQMLNKLKQILNK